MLSITPATFLTIFALRDKLDPAAAPLAKVIFQSIDDRHLPSNIRAGMGKLFTDRPIDWDDPVYAAVRELVFIGTTGNPSTTAMARVESCRRVLYEEDSLEAAMAAMAFYQRVHSLCTADACGAKIH